MATEAKLRQLADKGCPVYYFYSSERYLVRQAVAAAVRMLSADSDEDATILDGAAPELEQLIMAAGTISFFGTRRVVVLPEIDPAAYGSKDLDELCSTLSSLENAVAVLGSVFPLERGKIKLGKQAQKLQAQCKAIGYTEELAKPRPFELKNLMMERAKAQGATLPDGAATALLERCGEDPFLLENEVDKLCALSGYQTVSASMVAEMGTVSLEADVFEMIRMITAKNATGACKKLQTLLRLQQEPIAITAAMIGSYVDLYRVKLGAAKRKNYSAVHKDFGYKGSDYRLKRSAETAAHYTLPQLEACLQVLLELDQSLKSQPVAAQTLLETALCRLALDYAPEQPAVLDTGCGEGYYTSAVYRALRDAGKAPCMAGTDISKAILRRAAKREKDVEFAVASSYHLPVADRSIDLLLNCFSPLALEEFQRELKQVLYVHPYPNEVKETPYEGFAYAEIRHVEDRIRVLGQEDIHALFQMTPYYWKTPKSGCQRLAALEELAVTISFDIHVFRRKE